MDATKALMLDDSAKVIQATQNTSTSPDPKATSGEKTEESNGNSFMDFLKQVLNKTGQEEVNEEEFFSGIIAAKLNEKDPEAAKYYREQVAEMSSSMARADGWVPVEDVAKKALKATVAAGKIDEESAKMINAEAFAGAQLDDVSEALYDGRGTTKAVASADEALSKLKLFMDNVSSGSLKLEARSLDIASNNGPVGRTLERLAAEGVGASGEALGGKALKFSWKEVASDGKLAILIPQPFAGGIEKVEILNSEGEVVERGNYSKRTGDGRPVFRFDHKGSHYGKDLDVVISKENGDRIHYHISDGSKRNTEWLEASPGAAQAKIEESEKELEKIYKDTKNSSQNISAASKTASDSSGSDNTPSLQSGAI